jgi:hypothetical protein
MVVRARESAAAGSAVTVAGVRRTNQSAAPFRPAATAAARTVGIASARKTSEV